MSSRGNPITSSADTPSAATTRVKVLGAVRAHREGLSRLLSELPLVSVVGSASPRDDLPAAIERLKPAVLLVDAASVTPDDFVRSIGPAAATARVVAYGVSEDDDSEAIGYGLAGVTSFATREESLNQIRAAVQAAARSEIHCSPRIAALLLRELAHSPRRKRDSGMQHLFTSRERQTVDLIEQGLSNKEIAHRLDVSVHTVKHHVHSILEKLGLHHRHDVAAHLRTERPHDRGDRSS